MSNIVDYIVVGSGCTGAMAAQTLVEGGKQVLMLDAGMQDTHYAGLLPDKPYIDIRRTEPEQHRYLLGEKAEGIAWGKLGEGEQITPPRRHIMEQVAKYLPLDSQTFHAVESLGYGGLGIGWGVGCWEFSAPELTAAGFDPKTMQAAYQTVCDRIGISATKDDLAPYALGNLKRYQPSPALDANHQLLYKNYLRHRQSVQARGFVVGRAPLALITKDLPGRKAYRYQGMDFYSDADKSAYRPWITVDNLRQQPNFTYRGGVLVTSFTELPDAVEVHGLELASNKPVTFRARHLVLTSGVLGTARIVLRSVAPAGSRLPLLANPYSYVPCIQPKMLGRKAEEHKLGFAHLTMFLDEDGDGFDVAMASLYSYQSLMLFRLIRQVPLNLRDAGIFMRYLMSGLVIMGIHHPDSPSPEKYIELRPDKSSPTGDHLHIHYAASPSETKRRKQRERSYMRTAAQLGAYPLKRIDPGFGSGIHYAGCLPYSKDEQPLTLASDGRLHGCRNVYVADGSGFCYLPAKGLTFTLMANAHRVAAGLVGQR